MSTHTPARVQPGVPAGGQFAAEARTEAPVSLTGPPAHPPLEPRSQRGEFTVVNASTEETPVESGGVTFREVRIHLGGRPHISAVSQAAGAAMQRAAGTQDISRQLHELAGQRSKATVLYATPAGDVIAKEGTLTSPSPGDVAIMHKGSPTNGVFLVRRTPTAKSIQILGVKKGFGHAETLAAQFRSHQDHLPGIEKAHFADIPDVGDGDAPDAIAAAFVFNHPGFDGGQDGRGSVFFVTDVQAEDGIVNGYGVYSPESGLTSERGSMYVADLERMGGRVSGLRPGAITYKDVMALDKKASAYGDGDFEPTWQALRAAGS